MKKSLIALSFGTFGLGIAEFVMMSILPYVAQAYGVSIPQAGNLISAYALGVCVGAPVTVALGRNYPLKHILLALTTIYALGNFVTAFAPSFGLALSFRFIAGLPHGAFFGVGSIVAERLADKGRKARALAVMIAGMTVANLLGVPLGTYLATEFSWRIIFIITGVWGVFNLVCMYLWLPYMDPLPQKGLKAQFRFLGKPSPWIILAITTLANGGIFCMLSFVNPLLTLEAGFSNEAMSWIMVLCGLAMVGGNLMGGKLSDRFPIKSVLFATYTLAGVALTSLFFMAHTLLPSLVLVVLSAGCLFAIGAPVQLLILQHSRGGEMLGAAMIQVAFNFGNALGAWNGGKAIELWHGYHYPALVGAVLLIIAAVLVLALGTEKKPSPATVSYKSA